MRPRDCMLVAMACLTGAVVATPPAPKDATTLPAAVAKSLGGMRVLLVDVLFLRAEQARTQGNADEARALYRTLLQMHPNNAPAVAHLVDIEFDGLPYILDVDERYGRFQELRAELSGVRPQSARLFYAEAQLILRVLTGKDTGMIVRLQHELGNPRRMALLLLGEAAVRAVSIARRGSNHLDRLAFLSVEVAAEGLVTGDAEATEEAVRIGRFVLTLRQEMLELIRHPRVANADRSDPTQWITLHRMLRLGLDAVDAIRADRASAGPAVEHFAEAVGDDLRSIPLLRKALR